MSSQGMKYLSVGEEFVGYCIIRKKELKFRKSGEPYLKLELGDTSGRLAAKSWKNAETLYGKLKTGQIIKVRAQVQSYRNFKELHIIQIRSIRQEEADVCQELLPRSRKNVSGLIRQFQSHLDSIHTQCYQSLLSLIFEGGLPVEEYLRMPSGKLWHHNYLFGNLEHLVCLMDLADIMCGHYSQLNRELLKTAIIVHNVGAPVEFSREGFIDYTTTGRLLGHVYLTVFQVQQKIEMIEDFPESLKLQLLHILSAQHSAGNENNGVKAMSFEAIVFSLIKYLDVQTSAAERILHFDRQDGSEWTSFNRLFQRFLYAGPDVNKKGADFPEEKEPAPELS